MTKIQLVGTAGLVAILTMGTAASAQVIVPQGTVLELQTTSELDSGTAQQGDTFSATVLHSVYVGGNLAIPQASSVDGRVTEVRPAVRGSRSGVIGVEFFRLALADGTSYDVSGVLTTRTQDENGRSNGQNGSFGRRDRNYVLIGGRRGTVVGELPDDANGSISGTISALLSSGAEAHLLSGSNIAMQLVSAITFAPPQQQGQNPNGTNSGAVYSSPRMVRRAQTALHDRNFYNGSVNGQLDRQTRQAIADFQSQNGQPVTGDLDQQTVARLGLAGSDRGPESTDRELAASIYREAQSLVSNFQSSLGVRINDISGGFTSNRLLTEGDLDLLLQANSFSNAAAWYQQAVANAPNTEGASIAARILRSSAQRVEASRQNAQANSQFGQLWARIQSDLSRVGASNSSNNRWGPAANNNPVETSDTGHFQWQGIVDGSDNIQLRSSQVEMTHLTAGLVQQATYQLSAALPLNPVQVTLRKVRGRGQIRLLEQPTASNNYTAVVQVSDPESGSAWYEFTLDW